MARRKRPGYFRVMDSAQQKVLLDALYQRIAKDRKEITSAVRDRMLIFLCLRTGLRNAEATGLNVGDIYQFGSVVLTLEVRADIAKGSVPRRLPLISEICASLSSFLQWKQRRGESLEHNAPLFCSLRSHKRLGNRDFQRIMDDASQLLGMRFTPHDLRHTFATELARRTKDVNAVKMACGHSSLQATMIYMHTSPDELRAKFEQAFSSEV